MNRVFRLKQRIKKVLHLQSPLEKLANGADIRTKDACHNGGNAYDLSMRLNNYTWYKKNGFELTVTQRANIAHIAVYAQSEIIREMALKQMTDDR